MNYEINKDLWHKCRICNQEISILAKTLGGTGIYYTDVFEKHLLIHQITTEEYFQSLSERPYCSCGICKQQVNIVKKGSKFYWRQYACGRNPGILEWSKRAKITRLGSNNPMYGQKPWNEGLTAETNSSVAIVAQKITGIKRSEATKKKCSDSALVRTIHGHTGYKHSDATKSILRQKTLENIKKGIFKQTKTKPHLAIKALLDKMAIEYEEEYVLGYWSFDFYLINSNILLEVDGDYFHSNPLIYPNGPKTKTQKVNQIRDISKNKFCQKQNIKLIRLWESDILNNIGEIECKLKKLLALNQ